MRKGKVLILFLLFSICHAYGQRNFNFRIRTITAGAPLRSLADTISISQAVNFLKQAQKEFIDAGYEVQTLRIATSNFFTHVDNRNPKDALPLLKIFDNIVAREGISVLSIGQVLPPGKYRADIGEWAAQRCKSTSAISFNISISSHHQQGIHNNSVKAAADIIIALSHLSNGEANFRFTALANCPANIPFFPAAFHEGVNSFGIGLETPNLLTEAFGSSDSATVKQALKEILEKNLKPIEILAERISSMTKWKYDGIDVSPAPGLDASIGQSIEACTKQPFGSPSTLGACAMILIILTTVDHEK